MGGFLGSIGSGIKNAVSGVGHAVGSVLDNKYAKAALAAGLAATGVGAPAAAGIMAGSGILGGALHEGGGLNDAIRGGYQGALTGGAAGLAGSSGLLGKVGGLAKAGASNLGGSAIGAIKDHAGDIGGSLLSTATGAGSGGLSPAILALAGLQGVNAAQLGAKSNQYADNAMQYASDSWKDRAGLRSAGIAGLQTPRPMQSLSGLSAIRGQNPVARRAGLPPNVVGG